VAPEKDGFTLLRLGLVDRFQKELSEGIHGRGLCPRVTTILTVFHPEDFPLPDFP